VDNLRRWRYAASSLQSPGAEPGAQQFTVIIPLQLPAAQFSDFCIDSVRMSGETFLLLLRVARTGQANSRVVGLMV
jgi:hypothetical protein